MRSVSWTCDFVIASHQPQLLHHMLNLDNQPIGCDSQLVQTPSGRGKCLGELSVGGEMSGATREYSGQMSRIENVPDNCPKEMCRKMSRGIVQRECPGKCPGECPRWKMSRGDCPKGMPRKMSRGMSRMENVQGDCPKGMPQKMSRGMSKSQWRITNLYVQHLRLVTAWLTHKQTYSQPLTGYTVSSDGWAKKQTKNNTKVAALDIYYRIVSTARTWSADQK